MIKKKKIQQQQKNKAVLSHPRATNDNSRETSPPLSVNSRCTRHRAIQSAGLTLGGVYVLWQRWEVSIQHGDQRQERSQLHR